VLVILPTFNEAGTLAEVVGRIFAAAPSPGASAKRESLDPRILIIDDASTDGTAAIADGLAEADERITVMHRPAKLGLGTAYVEGFRVALERGVRWVVEMDSDGSHLPEQLGALLDAANAGAGLVIGTRWMPGGSVVGWPWHRRWVSRTGTKVARIALRSNLHDITSGFRVIDTAWLERVPLDDIAAHGYGFQVETAHLLERLGCPIAEVPIQFVERRSGRSKMTLGIVVEALWLVFARGWQLRVRPRSATQRAR